MSTLRLLIKHEAEQHLDTDDQSSCTAYERISRQIDIMGYNNRDICATDLQIVQCYLNPVAIHLITIQAISKEPEQTVHSQKTIIVAHRMSSSVNLSP